MIRKLYDTMNIRYESYTIRTLYYPKFMPRVIRCDANRMQYERHTMAYDTKTIRNVYENHMKIIRPEDEWKLYDGIQYEDDTKTI